MEIMSVPATEEHAHQICLETDMDFMHVGILVNGKGRSFSCLTLHYSNQPQLSFLQDLALKMKQERQKPEVYLDEHGNCAEIIVVFQLPLSPDVCSLLWSLLPVSAYQVFIAGSTGSELIILAAADFDFKGGETRFGIKEFLNLHQQKGCFYVGVYSDQDTNLSPHPEEFQLETINKGLPPILSSF